MIEVYKILSDKYDFDSTQLFQLRDDATTPGGYSDFHTYVGSGHFLGFKILNFNIFRGFQKNKYFGGV